MANRNDFIWDEGELSKVFPDVKWTMGAMRNMAKRGKWRAVIKGELIDIE